MGTIGKSNSESQRPLSARRRAEARVQVFMEAHLRRWQALRIKSCTIRPHIQTLVDQISPGLEGYKLADKKKYLAYLLAAAEEACYWNCCLRYSRNEADPQYSHLNNKVIAFMIANKYLVELRGKPGGIHQSRLFVTQKLREHFDDDPWTSDPPDLNGPFDSNPEENERLKLINGVIAKCKITVTHEDPVDSEYLYKRRLRPLYHRSFKPGRWSCRLYDGRYGVQNLPKALRETIRFNGQSSVEYDLECTHLRLAYHLSNLDYCDDGYKLWGVDTTKEQRRVAKAAINISLNAANPIQAREAFTLAMQTTGKDGQSLRGNDLKRARELARAYKMTQMSFDDIYDLILTVHAPIKEWFCADSGITLMVFEGMFMTKLMVAMAEEGIPCLAIHDSFIIPEIYATHFDNKMHLIYASVMGHYPVVKDVYGEYTGYTRAFNFHDYTTADDDEDDDNPT